MKKSYSLAFYFCLGAALLVTPLKPSIGQEKPTRPSSAAEKQSSRPASPTNESASEVTSAEQSKSGDRDRDDVVKISVTLVQVDAVVTNKKGRHVTDLKPEDFEISEDGKRQHITNFSYVAGQPIASPPAAESGKPAKQALPIPPMPTRLRPEAVRRTIALVVDDLGLSYESTSFVRDALKKFVAEQMQEGDLVAIIRTGAGVGALQQFTTDKRLLNAAIERIRWNPNGRGGLSAFSPLTFNPLSTGKSKKGEEVGIRSDTPDPRLGLDRFREDLFAVGTLGAMNYVIRGLRDLPGRKSVLLISDGFAFVNRPQLDSSPIQTRGLTALSRSGGRVTQDVDERVYEALKRLTDLANRASVVVYAMDPRGLQSLELTGGDATVDLFEGDAIDRQLRERRDRFLDLQDGLRYLADETGGLFIRNTNDLNRGIRSVLNDQQGYYLLGYVPEASSFRKSGGLTTFHRIQVKVKRAGLSVRSRTGFLGYSDEETRAAAGTPAQRIARALTSPFASSDIGLKLTSLFVYDQQAGAYMRSLLHIDPNEVAFNKEADGQYKAIIEVVAFTFGDNGQVVDQISRQYSITVPEATYEQIKSRGLLYNLNVPVKKPGAYQLRVAVRDTTTEKIGSASQFIEVPDIGKKRLTLSGIVVQGMDSAKPASVGAEQAASATEGATDSQSSPSQRVLRPGMRLQYGFAIYNARIDRASGQPQLEAQVRLLRNGQAVYTSKAAPVRSDAQADWREILVGGSLDLGAHFEPGEYLLQVIVTDRQADDKHSMATQWVDFEVVK
jgi:VWFA-related protein